MFRSNRGRLKNSISSTNKEEDIPLENKKQSNTLRRTSSVGKDDDRDKTQQYRRQHIQRRSDTVAVV